MTATEPTDEDRARIAARYPSRRKLDLLVGGIVGVVLLATGAIFLISGFIQSNPPVSAMVRSFTIAPQTASASVLVQRADPTTPVRCQVYAQADNFERVGEITLDVPSGTEKLTLIPVTLKTVREATTVQVTDCHVLE